MKGRSAATALALGALVMASSGEPGRGAITPMAGHIGTSSPPPVVTPPTVPAAPAVVRTADVPATRGWAGSPVRGSFHLADELVAAYGFAVAAAPQRCHLSLSLLAAIGQVESGNAAGRSLDVGHRVVPEIVGPALDGRRYAAIRDTDAGTLDHDRVWDHAVGPFQFIPSSWRAAGVDFDGDGVRDPQDVYDAAGGAMVYLCADDRDLRDPRQLEAAVLAYNHSRTYLRLVLRWQAAYETAGAWAETPALQAMASPVRQKPAPPPASVHPTASGLLDPVALHAEPPAPGAKPEPSSTSQAVTPDAPAPSLCPTSDGTTAPPTADPAAPTDPPVATGASSPDPAATTDSSVLTDPTATSDPTAIPAPTTTPDATAPPDPANETTGSCQVTAGSVGTPAGG